ncbi:MAG: protein-L-isoaspartate(D-aspartate) O-methyltransferase [Spirochaetales bacterium]|jgi:protein-L-isoaspartate(D-aspartate) O-methyltransferase|nr:protein-L-isoaspartate(D-aspartate) O-methyltransferase [Spirochaetales bacterium]
MIEEESRRKLMVARQIAARGINDPRLLHAFETVPRHLFVRLKDRASAYEDYPISIGEKQTISQPYIAAYMTEKLALNGTEKVLEIGTGSGYQAAVLSMLAGEVYTIETVESLHQHSRRLLASLGFDNVHCFSGDGAEGLPGNAPFDRIIITAATPVLPPTLCDQLAENGRMILPVGKPFSYQELELVSREETSFHRKRLLGVRFVPMTGKIQDV